MLAASSVVRGGGWSPSPFDPRNFSIVKANDEDNGLIGASEDFPDEWDRFFEEGHIRRVRDQLDTESCVGQDAAARAEAWASLHLGVSIHVSDVGLYTGGRQLGAPPGTPLVDAGSNSGKVMKFANKYGLVAYDRWPLSLAQINTPLPLDYFQNAYEHRVEEYYFVPGSDDTLMENVARSLSKGHPIGYAQPVDKPFDSYRSGVMDNVEAKNRGYHMTGIYGYRRNPVTKELEFHGLNSWGNGYGEDGAYWISARRLKAVGAGFTALTVGTGIVT